ncbi:MAG: fibronectin type III domain-containing protein, partial [Acutalibacteraceae bacterium]
SVITKCAVCGAVKSKSTIYAPKTVTLAATSYTYSGKSIKPAVKVVDATGKVISASNYTVKYSSNKYVGTAKVTITFKGNYSGTITKTFKINPKNTSISSLTAGSKKFTVKWKKYTTQTTGYQIQYSTKSSFSGAKTVTASKNSTTSKTVSKLKSKKKYYVRIRTYKVVDGTKYYSAWSSAKKVTTKK